MSRSHGQVFEPKIRDLSDTAGARTPSAMTRHVIASSDPFADDGRMSDITSTIDTYLDAYSEADPVRRAGLVETVFAHDAVLTDPPFVATGHEELVSTFGAVLEQFPGHRFHRRTAVDEHHGVARYAWSLDALDGTTSLTGLDVVTLGVDGKIVDVVGFMGDLAPVD